MGAELAESEGKATFETRSSDAADTHDDVDVCCLRGDCETSSTARGERTKTLITVLQ